MSKLKLNISIVLSILIFVTGCNMNKAKENIVDDDTVDSVTTQEINDIAEDIKSLFSDEEIEQAILMAEAHIEAVNKKDNKLILDTIYPQKAEEIAEKVENGNWHLYGEYTIAIESIGYLGDDHELTKISRKTFVEEFGIENVMPLNAAIYVEYPDGIIGAMTAGLDPKYCFYMIREDKDSLFYVYEQGH